MNIEKFTDMLLKSLEKMEVPAATVEHITEDGGLLGIATPDDSQFLIKIGKCDVEHETFFRKMDETNSRIHGIFERFTNSWEYNNIMMKNNIDLDWLAGKLDKEDYRKLENYILNLWLKNDELIFRVGFRYVWSLFNECTQK
ncbi:hypothetical protein C809_03876 [Lachnospiraceae bacterium MD335]|nr:hypothetical protein C809_03876 [Lachnospiraceae bacterium MD335]